MIRKVCLICPIMTCSTCFPCSLAAMREWKVDPSNNSPRCMKTETSSYSYSLLPSQIESSFTFNSGKTPSSASISFLTSSASLSSADRKSGVIPSAWSSASIPSASRACRNVPGIDIGFGVSYRFLGMHRKAHLIVLQLMQP